MGTEPTASRRYGPPQRRTGLPGALLAGCALSAGVHAGLAPAHLAESPLLGVSFVLAAALLLVLGLGVFVEPRAASLSLAVALTCTALIVAYAASRTLGLPALHPEREAVDAVGIVTNVIELGTLAVALRLYTESGRWHPPLPERRSTSWTPTSRVRRADF